MIFIFKERDRPYKKQTRYPFAWFPMLFIESPTVKVLVWLQRYKVEEEYIPGVGWRYISKSPILPP